MLLADSLRIALLLTRRRMMMSVMMGGADLHRQKKMRLRVHRVRLPKQPTGDARPLFSSVSGKSSFTEMATKKKVAR